MKLEAGMYVRTEYGIEKIVKIKESCTFAGFEEIINTDKNEYRDFVEHSKIKKASHTLLGEDEETCLIEFGDYVNGYKVTSKGNDCILGRFVQCDYPVQEGTTNHYRFYELDIRTIVTKEQFETMSYRVGD